MPALGTYNPPRSPPPRRSCPNATEGIRPAPSVLKDIPQTRSLVAEIPEQIHCSLRTICSSLADRRQTYSPRRVAKIDGVTRTTGGGENLRRRGRSGNPLMPKTTKEIFGLSSLRGSSAPIADAEDLLGKCIYCVMLCPVYFPVCESLVTRIVTVHH